jgi:acetylornithine deacetylase
LSVADRPVVALLRSLVRIPSESGREEGVRDAVAAWLRARDVPATVTGRNVVVVLEGAAGSDPARGLLFCSHYDTVPVGPGWTRPDPVDGALEGGKVFGRGSNDAKASIAAMLCVAAGVDRARLVGRLVFAFVCDEETGGQGLEAVAPTLPPLSAAVIGEPTGLDVSPGQRGLLRAYVHETGRSCHASRPWEGVNALEAAARDVLAIRGIEMPEEHPLFGRATLAPTMLAAGTKPNVIPGAATITLDGVRPGVGQRRWSRRSGRPRGSCRGEEQRSRAHRDRRHGRSWSPRASPTHACGFGVRPSSCATSWRRLGPIPASHAPDEWVASRR